MMKQLNESEVPIAQMLQTLTASTWQQQIQTISALKVSPQLVKLINHRNYSAELASLFASHNPRTKLITVLSEFLIELFSSYASQLIPFANLLISNECLLRLLGSGNKVVCSSANEVIKCMLGNIDFKAKGKQVKFVTSLENQFLNSKNGYVREKISLYFILISTSFYYNTKEALIDFERKVVKQGLEDANEKILQSICHFQKENQLSILQQKPLHRKSTDKALMKISKAPRSNKSSKVLNTSSLNQSSIVEHFAKIDKAQEMHNKSKEMNEESYKFYLQQLKSTSNWAMVLIAFESLVEMIGRKYLIECGSDQLYCQTIRVLTPFLNEKRSRIYQTCALTYRSLLQDVLTHKKEKVTVFCQEQTSLIIEHLIKNENEGLISELIKALIALSPSFFLPKLAEISVALKIYREKLILLDSIVVNLSGIYEAMKVKGGKRIGAMVRAMCQHIETSSVKEKEVSLAALAIISQLKQKYSQEVLTALLCQNDRTLTKILEVADSIDQSLKQAIIEYINSLKGAGRKPSQKQLALEKKNLQQVINKEIAQVTQQKVANLNRLGEAIFTHLEEMECKHFVAVLTLLEFLCTADLIMEYKVLMQQISKLCHREFTKAIVCLLTTGDNRVREHHDILLLELLQAGIHATREDDSTILKCLAHVYRTSDWSVKKRSLAIELLSKVKEEALLKEVNEDERLLIETYRETMEDEFMIG